MPIPDMKNLFAFFFFLGTSYFMSIFVGDSGRENCRSGTCCRRGHKHFANSLLRAENLLSKRFMRAVASILSQIVAMAFVVTMAAFLVVPSSTTPAGAFAMSNRDKYTCKDSGFQLINMDTAASPITCMIQLLPSHHQLMLQLLCLRIWIE